MELKEEKRCYKCKNLRSFSNFRKDKESKDGYGDICRPCLEKRKILNRETVIQQNASTLEKTCYRCNTTKHISQFGSRYETTDGRSRFCKACRNNKKGTLPPSAIIDNPDGTRVCKQCNVAKPLLTAFRRCPRAKFGYEGRCRDCVQKGVKIHVEQKRVLRVEGMKTCPSCKKEKDVNEFGKSKTFLDGRAVYCLECTRAKGRIWRVENPEATLAISKRKYQKNKDNVQAKIKNALRQSVRRRIRAIQGGDKAGSGVEDLGCSIEFFQKYIESLWQPGQTWENWSKWGWHIDHIKPLASFDLTNREQLLEVCNYKNLRPMWWNDNISKGAKSPEEFTRPLSDGPAIPPSLKYLQLEDPIPLTNLS